MSTFKFSRRVRTRGNGLARAEIEAELKAAHNTVRSLGAALLEAEESNKPPAPMEFNAYCLKMAELKQIEHDHKCDLDFLCSPYVKAAFCNELGGTGAYEKLVRAKELMLLIARSNLLHCELAQNGVDLETAAATVQACCESVAAAAAGKEVSSNTYRALALCYC